MGYPRKNPKKRGGGVEDMEFPGVNWKQSAISKGDQEKIMWNFQGSLFLALEFPRDLTQFCGISRHWALCCLEFPEVKNEKFQGGFKKV